MDDNLYEDIISKYINDVDIEYDNANLGWILIHRELGEISERMGEVELAGL